MSILETDCTDLQSCTANHDTTKKQIPNLKVSGKRKTTASMITLANIQPILYKASFEMHSKWILMTNMMKPAVSQSPMPMKQKQHREKRNQITTAIKLEHLQAVHALQHPLP